MFDLQFVPESPRYLILKNKEDKAKKVLALMAKVNCKQPLSGRLVTQEIKEQMIKDRNQITSVSPDEPLIVASENHSGEVDTDNTSCITQPNKETTIDNELPMMSSDNGSDSEVLLVSTGEQLHRQMHSQGYIKRFIKDEATKYRDWFSILFKNGYWRTTLLLWYIWYVRI